MTAIPLYRRILSIAIALALATCLLRAQISSALVVRGDDFSVRGDATRAARYYSRALWFDERDGVAIDRLAFAAVMTHRPVRMLAALTLVSKYLKAVPNDRAVLMDRAMTEDSLGAYGAAERDYARLGALASDARAYTFAGFGALHSGSLARARIWWKRAVALDPHFLPPQRALERIH